MKALVGALNQEKALVGAFSVITNLRMELFQALINVVLVQHRHAEAEGRDDSAQEIHRQAEEGENRV